MTTPIIYDLRNDADAKRFGLTPAQRDRFMLNRFANRSGRKPTAIFVHVQEGTTKGSLEWAIGGGNNSWTVTAQHDGSILRCIPEEHGPWTNGAVRSPKPTAQKLLALGGNPNLYTLSIECEGYWNKPFTAEQIEAAYWQVRRWQERYGIPDDWVFEHADVDSVQRANCAGPRYDAIRALMAKQPEPAPSPSYAAPSPIAELRDAGAGSGFAPAVVRLADGTSCVYVGDRVQAVRETPRKRYSTGDQVIGPPILPGEVFPVDWLLLHPDREAIYYSPWATRIKVADTIRVSDSKDAA